METNNKQYDEVINYFEGKLKFADSSMEDISYEYWVNNDENFKLLCKAFEVSFKDGEDKKSIVDLIMKKHDFECEFKLIGWITEDEAHTDKFIDLKGITALNRYPDILPYKYNTVFISQEEKNIENFITGSYINGPFTEDNNMFIATQGPLESTTFSFWKLILTQQIKVIFMLANCSETGQQKSVQYWPSDVNDNKVVKDQKGNNELTISLISEESIYDNSITIRKIKINNEFEVEQVHITAWPDHSVPEPSHSNDIINFSLSKIDHYHSLNSSVIVHCSAGVGRTGTLIAIYNIIRCLNRIKLLKETNSAITQKLNVFNVVRKLREERFKMVIDKRQYQFIYEYCLDWIANNF